MWFVRGSLQTAVAYAEQHGNNAVILAVNAKDPDIQQQMWKMDLALTLKLQPVRQLNSQSLN